MHTYTRDPHRKTKLLKKSEKIDSFKIVEVSKMTTEQPQITGHAHRRDSITEVLGTYVCMYVIHLLSLLFIDIVCHYRIGN